MKRSILIIALMSLFLCSCDKDNVDLTESVPGIEGSWKWELSSSNVVFGIYVHEKNLVRITP